MVKYIQLGFFNKKLLLPFGVALLQIIINVMNIIIPEQPKNSILEMFFSGISEVSSALIPCFTKNSFKDKKRLVIYKLKQKIAHHTILFFIFVAYVILNIIMNIQTSMQNKSMQNPHNSGISLLESLELIFICIVSILLLKYKYFTHHIISIIIFILVCFFIDLIIGNFSYILERGVLFIVLNFIEVIVDACDYGYQKYMMDILYYPFWSLAVTIGLVNITIFGIVILICLIKGKEEIYKEQNGMFMIFYQYFDNVDIGIIITKQILNFILSFFLNLLRVLTILHLTPEHILISFSISRIINIVLETKKFECLALFVIQFITLMFYLEIIELNFCGLNKNTRRNIQKRGEDELIGKTNLRDSTASLIEFSPDYIITTKGQDINITTQNTISNSYRDYSIELTAKSEW